ncbi:MAG: hypothetical protein JF615_01470 [Asticcacaulis sp.]|nr:hypothetical protein [Asticcacaulis sp.]
MRILSTLAASLLLFAAPAATFAQTAPAAPAATAPMVVYDDALMPGWDNWSWAKVTFSKDIGSDIKPIAVEGDAWSALAFHHAPFSTAGYTKLTFYINGGTSGGQPIAIKALSGGKTIESNYIIHLTANAWNVVEVPLNEIGAANTTIDGLWLQAMTNQPYSAYYVTIIQFE